MKSESNLVVMTVCESGRTPEYVRKFMADRGWNPPTVLDPWGSVARQVGADHIPVTIVVSPDGTIKTWHLGEFEFLAPEFVAEFKKLGTSGSASAPQKSAGL